jgi:hypothetical protein
LGIFDLKRSGGTLGTFIILLEELEIQRHALGADSIDVIVVTDASDLINGSPPHLAPSPVVDTYSRDSLIATLESVARAILGSGRCHFLLEPSEIGEAKRMLGQDRWHWPAPQDLHNGRHHYDSTLFIQAEHSRMGRIPRLKVQPKVLSEARSYLQSCGGEPVAVHLKRNERATGQSNADLASWLQFFATRLAQRSPQRFFLLGHDPVDVAFRDRPNVTIVQDDIETIGEHLALIQAAELFMGMMSGLSNMALFGERPYLIFKNPDHHRREMLDEMGEGDAYSFALPDQRVLRIKDEPKNLESAFDSVVRRASAQAPRTSSA